MEIKSFIACGEALISVEREYAGRHSDDRCFLSSRKRTNLTRRIVAVKDGHTQIHNNQGVIRFLCHFYFFKTIFGQINLQAHATDLAWFLERHLENIFSGALR